VASIWVRYDSGDIDEWELTDALVEKEGLEALMRKFGHSLYGGWDVISFPVKAEGDGTRSGVAFEFVSVQGRKVVAWRLNGLTNESASAALWAEMEGPTGD
jgi:hypothetical protein